MAAQDTDVIETTVIHDNSITGIQVNRYQWKLSTGVPVDDATLLDDVAFIIESLYDLIKTIIAIRNVFREVRVTNVTQNLLVGSTTAGAYLGGVSTGNDAPQGVSAFVYCTTNVPRVILSKYLPSPTVSDVNTDGGVIPGEYPEMVAYAAALLVPYVFNGTSYTYGYLSPKVLSFVIPQVSTPSFVYAYQRRRKKGRGA